MVPSSSKYEAALTIRPGTSKKGQLGHGFQAWDARPRPGLKFLAKDHRFGAFNWYALTQRLGGLKKKDLQQNCKRQMANGCTQWVKILSQETFLYYQTSTQRCILPVSFPVNLLLPYSNATSEMILPKCSACSLTLEKSKD